MARVPPPYIPPFDPGPTSASYTPAQYERIKSRFKDLFRITPKLLRPTFLLLHNRLGNSYPSVDRGGRFLVRIEPREENLTLYARKCTNDAVNAGAHTVKLEPATGSIVSIYYISSVNRDALAVNNNIALSTAGAGMIANLGVTANLAANVPNVFPRGASGTAYLGRTVYPSLIITDEQEISIYTGSVDVSEDTDFFILYSYLGDAPTITETGPTNSAYTDIS